MTEPHGLAFKAYEIEELADVYFFRPLGMLVARAARALGLSPTAVTIVAAVAGVLGGALLSVERLALAGFAVLVVHSVLDSSDGQLARMTGRVTDFGRVLDGVSGYATHIAIYAAVVAGALTRGAHWSAIVLALPAAVANIIHAQMYDYYRSAYSAYAIEGVAASAARGQSRGVASVYEKVQARLAGRHREVEALIEARAIAGRIAERDRRHYREMFYPVVRGWNVLGDNTRFYAIGVLAWMHRVDLFPAFVLLPMNAAFVLLSICQRRADRRFLRAAGPPVSRSAVL